MKTAVETRERTPLFCNVTLCEQVNEDKPRPILVLSDGPVYLDRTEALINKNIFEGGHLLEMGRLLEGGR